MTNKNLLQILAASLLLIQSLTGCQSSEKPFPDNTYKWDPKTEKPFPDNTYKWDPKTEKPFPDNTPGWFSSAEKSAESANTQTEPTTAAQKTSTTSQFIINQPTSFRGVVPCSDCEDIELVLTLRPDQVFFLRKDFNRLPKRSDDRTQELGGWKISPDGNELILKRGNGAPQRLAIISESQLDVLNAEGKSINNSDDYQLTRLESAMQLIDSADLSGLYFEDVGRGYWLECQSGVTWPVARAGAYAQLSKKYNAMDRPSEKTTLLADITGHLVQRPDDSKSTTEYLVVDKFKSMRNGVNCE
jgi:uncharacterized lipoprotein NlpE involved in copper resistance